MRVQAIVTQIVPGLGGFYIQEEDGDADGDAHSSEGIFIASNAAKIGVDSSGNALPTATVIEFPTATVVRNADGDYVANLEAYEGMRVTIPQDVAVTELFQLDRFGTIRLSSDGRLEQFTQSNAPRVEGYQQYLKEVAARSLVLDDGSSVQNPADLLMPFLGEDGTLTAGDSFRMGDAYRGLTGVVSFSEDSATASEEPEYRIHLPSEGELVQNNPRPTEAPDVGGTIKVAGFNVLNYFHHDHRADRCGWRAISRGANNDAEFARQEARSSRRSMRWMPMSWG